MAEKLTKLEDLKTRFAQFGEMTDLIARIRKRADEINDYNINSAGHDEIGKEYHKNADEPTKGLLDLFASVEKEVGDISVNGQNTTTILDNADEEAKKQV